MSFYPDYLSHQGIPNMKWGVKNGPPYPLDKQTHNEVVKEEKDYSKELLKYMEKGDKGYNLDRWGKDKKHNLLAITGISGSGKSTMAYRIAKENNAHNINLDVYIDNPTLKEHRVKEFDNYLKKSAPNFSKFEKDPLRYIDAEKGTKDYKIRWDAVDEVRECLMKFSVQQYGKKKVVAEGVQWSDDTLYGKSLRSERNEFLAHNPVIFKNTSILKSTFRRYDRRNDLTVKEFINDIGPTLSWQNEWKKDSKEIQKFIIDVINKEEV